MIGIALVLIGLVAFVYQGVTYTTRAKVLGIDPIHMTADKTRTLPLGPIVGAVALAGSLLRL
jgi:hypothetical protein